MGSLMLTKNEKSIMIFFPPQNLRLEEQSNRESLSSEEQILEKHFFVETILVNQINNTF